LFALCRLTGEPGEDFEPSSPPPLAYESKQDFKRRRRFLILAAMHWEVIRFVLWMVGFLIVGLVLGVLGSFLR
jgi:hypothetical protein